MRVYLGLPDEDDVASEKGRDAAADGAGSDHDDYGDDDEYGSGDE